MVTNITSLTGNGLKDWLIQRVTAVILGVYFVALGLFFLSHPHCTYHHWSAFYQHPFFKIVNVIAILALVKHAWIGLWTITTDYLSCACLRVGLQMLILLGLFAELVWFLMILWG